MFEMPAKPADEYRVRRDWADLRDIDYEPALSILRHSVSIDPKLLIPDGNSTFKIPVFGLRDQKSTGRCVGYALANLIDLQLGLQYLSEIQDAAHKDRIVSADMLYYMAYFHDQYPELDDPDALSGEGVQTLRSVIKGFYHHGVCPDWPKDTAPEETHFWQSSSYCADADPGFRFPTVEQAKKARDIGLGAYFRLKSVLNHFHTALNDAGAILASANIHDGWWAAVPENNGVIKWPPDIGKNGTHAFVIVGYDKEGFHVLNSWGSPWGGYLGQRGVALWKYEDWARNIVDAWVLRLGVHAPTAFDLNIGEKGTKGFLNGPVQSSSTPCFELIGHYMHLDDGLHVKTGSYPSHKDSWAKTRAHIADHFEKNDPDKDDYDGILIWIAGSLEGIKPAFAAASHRKKTIKSLRLYPYSIFWCNSFAERSLEVLTGLFDIYKEQVGARTDQLDLLIESKIQGIGRAFWRDFKRSAYCAVWGEREHSCHHVTDPPPQGALGPFIADLIELQEKTNCRIHLVAEAAGAQVVNEIVAMLDLYENLETTKGDKIPCPAPERIFDTLHLIHPSLALSSAQKHLIPLIEKMNAEGHGPSFSTDAKQIPAVRPLIAGQPEPRARIYIPGPDLQNRIHFGNYGKSVQHLIARSFERCTARSKTDMFLGTAELAEREDFPVRNAIYLLDGVRAQRHPFDRIAQTTLNDDTTIEDFIFDSIRRRSDQKKTF